MDGEQAVDAQPEASDVQHVVQSEVSDDFPSEVMDGNASLISLDTPEEMQNDVSQNDGATHEGDESFPDGSNEIHVDVATELSETPLPSWIVDGMSDELNDILPIAIRHVKAKRGGDLLGIIMPTVDPDAQSKRRGKLSLLIIIKGDDWDAEWIRVKRQLIEIAYRGQKGFEEKLQTSMYLPQFLRKARVLFDRDGAASKICDMATKRFRQGPPHPSINEKIHLKAECYHWLGKIQEAANDPGRARSILPAFVDQIVISWFRLRGLWQVSVSDELQFISARDQALGEGLRDIWNEPDITKQVELAQRIASHMLKAVPWPARLD